MRHLYLIIIGIFILGTLYAGPRGTTQAEFPTTGSVYDQAPEYHPPVIISKQPSHSDFNREEWMLADSLKIRSILPVASQLGAKYRSSDHSAQLFSSLGSFSPEAIAAIAKAPLWIQPELTNVLLQLSPERQIIWANTINNAVDPYIDEIAFCIATSTTAYLESALSNPQLFIENAQYIYSIDTDLSYVTVVDHGSSTSDPNYYSTTTYRKYNANNELVSVEVPRDIYYWYIVHPKITDEIPAYIDPALVENNANHANNITTPPTGQFWRSFLYSVQEGDYPVLSDTLTTVQTVFNHNGNTSDAIHALQWWINHTMAFTSNAERPHQPVRIYRKHFGRCGEYADYTCAVARLALIPCTSIFSLSGDHTWNEFWDEGWTQWEPVNGYINDPLVYEDGWGKVFGSVFEIRSDGYFTPVTDRYSSGLANILVHVADSTGVPIDGARVILAYQDTGFIVDMISFTDNAGNITFPVGENHSYFARVETPIGIYPPVAGTYSALCANAVDGGEYAYQLTVPCAMPIPTVTDLGLPADTDQDWRLGISFSVPSYYISGRVTWDDISAQGSTPRFYKQVNEESSVNLLITDEDNYLFYQTMLLCDANLYLPNVLGGFINFNVPAQQNWYAFFDNSTRLANAPLVQSVMLYEHYGVGVDDQIAQANVPTLYQNYPNPFNPTTELRFNLPTAGEVSLRIYNLRGQQVRELFHGTATAGSHNLVWDGTDDNSNPVAGGMYLYRLHSGQNDTIRKMVLLK